MSEVSIILSDAPADRELADTDKDIWIFLDISSSSDDSCNYILSRLNRYFIQNSFKCHPKKKFHMHIKKPDVPHGTLGINAT